eukprot:m.38241 g.38241  ORF g.38241 m.38241 type:complete len:754 (+) comp32549_c0_seq1:75-2336(+)
MEIGIDDLEFHEHAGGGAFGSVYKAFWKSRERIVAVKKLLAVGENELQVLSMLSHRNIIQFYCAVTRAPNFCLVTEFASRGSLFNYLRKSPLGFSRILTWAREIALGVNYLHNEAPITVIHRDLKSKNVVISEDSTAKLCDFGCSRVLAQTTKMSLAGTFPWMSPEVIQQHPVSTKCDVFSYGVLLWELLTQEVPFKGLEGLQIAWLVVAKNERLTVPSSCPTCFSKLMTWCWKTEPKDRPDLRQVLDELQAMARDEALSSVTESFLHNKDAWMKEIESTLDNLKRLEKDLNVRENQLVQRELKLSERERELQNFAQVKAPEEHDVNAWSEIDVRALIQSLGVSGYGRDLAMYAPVFFDNNINGKRILMLTDSDLKAMGILSVGHRVELMDEFDKLRKQNQRLRHFPPLPPQGAASAASPVGSVFQSVETTFVVGMFCRRGVQPGEVKYKMYLEVDWDGDVSLTFVKDVTYIFSKAVPIDMVAVSQAPFCMEKWRSAETGQCIQVECIITYESFVKKPKTTRLLYDVELGREIPPVIEEKVQFQLKSRSSGVFPSNFQDGGCDCGSVTSGGQTTPTKFQLGAGSQDSELKKSYSHILKTGKQRTPELTGGAWQHGNTSAALGVGVYSGESQAQVQRWPTRTSGERHGGAVPWHRRQSDSPSLRIAATHGQNQPIRKVRSATTMESVTKERQTVQSGRWCQVESGRQKNANQVSGSRSSSHGRVQWQRPRRPNVQSGDYKRSSSAPEQQKKKNH